MASSIDVVDRITNALECGRAIDFCDPSPDNTYPEVKWQIFGLIDTNEIAVIASCGEFRVGISRESWLLFPSMADRIFGVDIADLELAHQLTRELWEEKSTQLIELAERIRSSRNA